MESKRVTCHHCDFLFYPEEGVSLDNCPVCGRTVEVKPAPAPLPEDDGEICSRLLSACTGHPHALIPWPHRLLHDAVSHISDLTRRLAEAGKEACEAMAGAHAEQEVSRHWKEEARWEQIKRKCAEARVRELEATIDAMAEAHAHDDQALTAAYLSGAHEGKKQAEAERDALRERCGKLEAALVEIGESEDRICNYCEGEGNRYADGKAHYYSEHAPTIPCPECGGRGRIRDMDSEDMAAVALAALAATEVKP